MIPSRSRFAALLLHVPLLMVGATMLVPLAFMFVTALAAPGEAMQASESLTDMLVPQSWHWDNFAEVWRIIPFGRYYLNSLLVALAVTLGQTVTSACAAYAFARLQWGGRDTVFMLYLATMMVPAAVTMIPNFVAMKMLPEILTQLAPWIDWMSSRVLGTTVDDPAVGRLVGLDSYFALIVPMMFSAYGTFLLRQFFLSIPRELDEAAEIDGCGHWAIFARIILPLSLPGLATLAIFTFLGVWGSFLWPLVVTNQSALNTLPIGLLSFQGQYGTEWSLMMAAALLTLVPIVVIFLVGQRFFVAGLTVGAVKG
ncbi:carbohydrate ABC transporter permease [Synoicihabitans lomoniglobus]|uniref:Carbohydrate ABC transporter permease n=1 Tax=Synoicihabitans lomoniglobus TaxID=2909285 RepID=A0AAF0A0F0_9BACT|nr:carbohydrate ABC transporter permease [Opitutaceae bacterium LMO-M01]WED64207.1 carbohydrate ABC transporter permease [Opitutaceae bacterium LMO-M01]